MLSGALALALAAPLAAPALVPETIVDRHNEEVGSVAFPIIGAAGGGPADGPPPSDAIYGSSDPLNGSVPFASVTLTPSLACA
jgi:hypothetical protein